MCPKYVDHSRFNSWHNQGDLCDHFMGMRIFTLIVDNIFMWVLKVMTKVVAVSFWNCYHLLPIVWFMAQEKGVGQKKQHVKSTTLVSIVCLCPIEMNERKDDYDIATTGVSYGVALYMTWSSKMDINKSGGTLDYIIDNDFHFVQAMWLLCDWWRAKSDCFTIILILSHDILHCD